MTTATGPTTRHHGRHYRVADPAWSDPLDGAHARRRGGRWNAPGERDVVYLNADVETARLNVRRRLAGQPYGPEDLDDDVFCLVATDVPDGEYLDLTRPTACAGVGLPHEYPRDAAGETVPHAACHAVGRAAERDGLRGILCPSAADGATPANLELAHFSADAPLVPAEVLPFSAWY